MRSPSPFIVFFLLGCATGPAVGGHGPGHDPEEQEDTLDCRLVWAGTFSITPVSTPGESKWRYIQRRLREMGFDSTRETQWVFGRDEQGRRFWEAYMGEGLRYTDPACSAGRRG
jgi:hypothetical protein